MMCRGVYVVYKPVGCRFVSIGGGRSPVFVLEIQISNIVSNEHGKTEFKSSKNPLTYQKYYYRGPRQVPD